MKIKKKVQSSGRLQLSVKERKALFFSINILLLIKLYLLFGYFPYGVQRMVINHTGFIKKRGFQGVISVLKIDTECLLNYMKA
jgi:hypothetical protein